MWVLTSIEIGPVFDAPESRPKNLIGGVCKYWESIIKIPSGLRVHRSAARGVVVGWIETGRGQSACKPSVRPASVMISTLLKSISWDQPLVPKSFESQPTDKSMRIHWSSFLC